MSRLISNVTFANMKFGPNTTSVTVKTPAREEFVITDCLECKHPLFVDGPRIYSGKYEYIGSDKLKHQTKAILIRFQIPDDNLDFYELIVCE